MIGQLTGTISYTNSNPVIIDVGGVGFEVFLTTGLYCQIKTGEVITVYTHTHVREDALELFGFPTRRDLFVFHQLITVSGVGPKTALAVADRGAEAVEHAIRSSDIDFFSTIPRLGRKNAQKIIIELKNKLTGQSDTTIMEKDADTALIMDALKNMGYSKQEIMTHLTSIRLDHSMKTEDKLKTILKSLAGTR